MADIETLINSYGSCLHTRGKDSAVTNLPTFNFLERPLTWNEHQLNLRVERPDIRSYFPCQENGEDILSYGIQKIGDVTFEQDETKHPGDIGYGFLRCDNTKQNSFLMLDDDKLTDYALDFWFRMSSKTNGTYIICNGSICDIRGTLTNGTVPLKAEFTTPKTSLAIGNFAPDQWHHFFYYNVGEGYRFAIDGKWICGELSYNMPLNMHSFGGWNDNNNPGRLNSIIEFCGFRLVKTTKPLEPATSIYGFRPPMQAYPYTIRGNRIYEHRFVPLASGLESPHLHCRIDDKVYGEDTFTDLDNLDKEHQLFHVKNVNGTLKDVTEKTTWTSTNVVPADIYGEAPMDFHHDTMWGKFAKSGGANITLGTGDFTFLVDFTIHAPKTDITTKDENGKALCIIDGASGALQMLIPKDLHGLQLDSSGKRQYVKAPDVVFEPNKEYRIIVQRRSSIMNFWLNGVCILKDALCDNDFNGSVTWLFGNTGTADTTFNGMLREAVLWSAAVVGNHQDVQKIDGTPVIKYTWTLDEDKAIVHGDIKKT